MKHVTVDDVMPCVVCCKDIFTRFEYEAPDE